MAAYLGRACRKKVTRDTIVVIDGIHVLDHPAETVGSWPTRALQGRRSHMPQIGFVPGAHAIAPITFTEFLRVVGQGDYTDGLRKDAFSETVRSHHGRIMELMRQY